MFSTKESRAKIDRARFHLSEIYSGFYGFLDGDLLDIPLRMYADRERSQIVAAINEIPAIPKNLGMLIGDAVHNYRSALDYLWWQLAVKNLSRSPSDSEAGSIQFPIFSDSDKWGKHRFFKHVSLDDVDFLKGVQPFNIGDTPNVYSPLRALNELSNHDKHRTLVPVLARAADANYLNCTGQEVTVEVTDLPEQVEIGTEVIRFSLDLEGVDVESAFSGSFRAQLTVHNNINILAALEAIDNLCDSVLSAADRKFG